MTMHRNDEIDGKRGDELVSDARVAASADAPPAVVYASHDQAVKVARGIMTKYHSVLSELAK